MRVAVKIFIAAALIFWLVQKGVLDFGFLVKNLTISLAVVSSFFVLLQLILNNWRWLILLRAKKINISFKECFRLTLIGQFFNFAVPGGVGGDVVKGYYLIKKFPKQITDVGTSVLFDRILGLIAMLILTLFVLFLEWDLVLQVKQIQFFLWLVAGLLFTALFFAAIGFSSLFDRLNFLKKLPKGEKIHKILMAFHLYGKTPKVILKTIGISFFSQMCIVLFSYFVGLGWDMNWSFSMYLFVIPLTTLAMAIPITPAGVGVGQAAIYFLVKAFTGQELDIGPNIITLFQVMSLLWGLWGAYFYVCLKPNFEKVKR